MRIHLRLVLAAVLLATASCGKPDGDTESGTTVIYVRNTSRVERLITRVRLYNYDTGAFFEEEARIAPDGKPYPVRTVARGGTWSVDVDFAEDIEPHYHAPSPPWIVGDVAEGYVAFGRK